MKLESNKAYLFTKGRHMCLVVYHYYENDTYDILHVGDSFVTPRQVGIVDDSSFETYRILDNEEQYNFYFHLLSGKLPTAPYNKFRK